MSIRRIESAYATFLGDDRLSGSDMSVLLALAYVANEKNNEACYPSDFYLERLTHISNRNIRYARKRLEALKVIKWETGGKGRQGGNISNQYRFLFPHCKMPTHCERYQQLGEPPTARIAVPYGKDCRTLRQGLPYPTAKVAVPYGKGCRLTRKEHGIEHRNRTSSLSLLPGLLKIRKGLL